MIPYDNLGNRVTCYCLSDPLPDAYKTWKMMVFKYQQKKRRGIKKLHKNKDVFIWEAAANEMDNHVDTYCFGGNFCHISFTLEDCNVSTFLT